MRRDLLILLVLVFVLGTASCSDDSSITTPNPPQDSVAGIYRGDWFSILDTTSVKLTFSFDELNDSTINGGVWIRLLNGFGHFERGAYRAEHTITTWKRDNTGRIVLAGEVDMGDDMGKTAFSGIIEEDCTFTYALENKHFSHAGTAHWAGEYLRQDVAELADKTVLPSNESSSVPSYVGAYPTKIHGTTPQGDEKVFLGVLIISGQTVSSTGTMDISGDWHSDYKFGPFHAPLKVAPHSEILAGELETEMAYAYNNEHISRVIFTWMGAGPWDLGEEHPVDVYQTLESSTQLSSWLQSSGSIAPRCSCSNVAIIGGIRQDVCKRWTYYDVCQDADGSFEGIGDRDWMVAFDALDGNLEKVWPIDKIPELKAGDRVQVRNLVNGEEESVGVTYFGNDGGREMLGFRVMVPPADTGDMLLVTIWEVGQMIWQTVAISIGKALKRPTELAGPAE